jgi:hypothetical protein
LTLSRAVIVAWLIGLFLYWKSLDSFKIQGYLAFMIGTVFVLFKVDFLVSLFDSGSGATKIEIYESLINKFPKEGLISQLFGNGINRGNYIYGWGKDGYSHAVVPMIVGQFGFFGLILYLSHFILGYLLFDGTIHLALIVFFVAGLSYLHPFLESIFIVNGFLIGLKSLQID